MNVAPIRVDHGRWVPMQKDDGKTYRAPYA